MEGPSVAYRASAHLQERKLDGWDHAMLGAHVMEPWQLPHNIAIVVAWHHQSGRAFALGGDVAQSVALLRLADRLEHQIRVGRQLDDGFVDQLERENLFEYTGYSSTQLRAIWPVLAAVVDDGRAILNRV